MFVCFKDTTAVYSITKKTNGKIGRPPNKETSRKDHYCTRYSIWSITIFFTLWA